MPTYMFKCRVCGKITEIQCSQEKVNDLKICGRYNPGRDGICEGKMDMVVEKKPQIISYRGTPRIRGWVKEKGL